jgi:transcriptional regulator with XRE-family HTH domain
LKLSQILRKRLDELVFSKMSKAELSRRLDIKPQSLQCSLKQWEEGKSFRMSTVEKIAEVTNIPYEELFKLPKEEN